MSSSIHDNMEKNFETFVVLGIKTVINCVSQFCSVASREPSSKQQFPGYDKIPNH
eukprot:m.65665 g.65665  ORF g.65665 m.65665 type:complete len:55 (+) comp19649_c1_seq1:249-413(+)